MISFFLAFRFLSVSNFYGRGISVVGGGGLPFAFQHRLPDGKG